MLKLKYIVLPLFFLLEIAIGYIRDFTFVHLNRYMADIYYHRTGTLPKSLALVKPLTYEQLYQLKFLLTIAFAITFLLITVIIIYLFFRSRKLVVYTVTCFAIIWIISACFFLYGWFLNDYEHGYRFSRVLLGFVQSPLLVMILLPAFMLYEKQKA